MEVLPCRWGQVPILWLLGTGPVPFWSVACHLWYVLLANIQFSSKKLRAIVVTKSNTAAEIQSHVSWSLASVKEEDKDVGEVGPSQCWANIIGASLSCLSLEAIRWFIVIHKVSIFPYPARVINIYIHKLWNCLHATSSSMAISNCEPICATAWMIPLIFVLNGS